MLRFCSVEKSYSLQTLSGVSLLGSIPAPMDGCPTSPISCGVRGFPELHAPFLKERRTRGPFQSCVQEIRGISLVFREMWDTAGLTLKPVPGPQIRRGAPCSHQRTWAENDGRSPSTAIRFGPYRLHGRNLCHSANALTPALASSLLPSRPLAPHTTRSPANPSSDLELRTAK